jgi:hypothetical protein
MVERDDQKVMVFSSPDPPQASMVELRSRFGIVVVTLQRWEEIRSAAQNPDRLSELIDEEILKYN